MGQLVFIIGKSGMGKSTSLRNLDENETMIINSDQKALPFRQFSLKYNEEKGNYVKTSDIPTVVSTLKKVHKEDLSKNKVVIDTLSHIITDHTMGTAFRGRSGFDKWTEFSGSIYDLINIINDKLRDDIIVYVLAHPETTTDEIGQISERIAVAGKQLEKVSLESFSTIVLYAEVLKVYNEPNRHVFRTKSSGHDTCKTPVDMFELDVIDNDLSIVDKAIREYYGL